MTSIILFRTEVMSLSSKCKYSKIRISVGNNFSVQRHLMVQTANSFV